MINLIARKLTTNVLVPLWKVNPMLCDKRVEVQRQDRDQTVCLATLDNEARD
jgi:hypothetical protein